MLVCSKEALSEPIQHGEPPQYAYPSRRDWRQGDPPPPGYHIEHGPWTGMIIGGVIPLAVFYSFSVMAASMSGYYNGTGWLLVPGVGPWLTLAARTEHCDPGTDPAVAVVDCTWDRTARGLLIFDGIVQTVTGAMVILGATTERERLVRDAPASFSVQPQRVGTGYGLGVSGQF